MADLNDTVHVVVRVSQQIGVRLRSAMGRAAARQ